MGGWAAIIRIGEAHGPKGGGFRSGRPEVCLVLVRYRLWVARGLGLSVVAVFRGLLFEQVDQFLVAGGLGAGQHPPEGAVFALPDALFDALFDAFVACLVLDRLCAFGGAFPHPVSDAHLCVLKIQL